MEIKTNAKIRVRLESFNHELLNSACRKLTDLIQNVPLHLYRHVEILKHNRYVYLLVKEPPITISFTILNNISEFPTCGI